MRILTLVWMMLVGSYLFSAPNCELYAEGTAAREACELCMKAISYPQGSPLSQKYFDKAMEVDPYCWSVHARNVRRVRCKA